ncbi:MAG TPA: hypothetical protein VLI05_06390 [Candidatus Saccharimonadia bacterium]|nr:hypothetical protein [Candidatus Saccharimonadia bacterium]
MPAVELPQVSRRKLLKSLLAPEALLATDVALHEQANRPPRVDQFRLWAVAAKQRFSPWMALVAGLAALVSCSAQVIRWVLVSTQGVTLGWPLTALIFAAIKYGRQRPHRTSGGATYRRQVRLSLALSFELICTNAVLLGVLLCYGANLFNGIFYITIGLWVFGALRTVRRWNRETSNHRFVRAGILVNIVPMYLQAANYLIVGVGGMPLWNLAVLEALTLGAFVISTWPFDDGRRGRLNRKRAFQAGSYVTFRLTRHELVAQSTLGLCGLISYFWLPGGHLDVPWNILEGLMLHAWDSLNAYLSSFHLHFLGDPAQVIA